MSQDKKKFKKYLEEGEIILNTSNEGDQIIPHYAIITIFILGIVLYTYGQLIDSGLQILGSIIIPFSILIFIINLATSSCPKYIAITNQKVIKIDQKYKTTFIPYEKIFDIEIIKSENNKIPDYLAIYLEPQTPLLPRKQEQMTMPTNLNFAYSNLSRYWRLLSPYNKLHKTLSSFLNKYKIKTYPIKYRGYDKIIIKGKIEEFEFSIIITNYSVPKKIQAELQCQNEENNYLYIGQEDTKDSIKKIAGMQDYTIGDKWVDEKFIIQSNHEAFIKYILDKDMIERIKSSNSYLDYSFSLGEKQKMTKKDNTFRENQTLDQHLLGNTDTKTRIKDHTSILKFESDNLLDQLDFELLGQSIVEKLELMIYLAKKINGYNNK